MTFHRANLCVALLLALGVSTGCKDKDAVKVYRVSKGEPESPAPQASEPGGGGMGSLPPMGAPSVPGTPSTQPSQVAGTAPANWEAQPLTSMRQASFLVKGDNGATADISLVALAGTAGGVLDNVNRWLSQLGQPAVTAEQLAKTAQHVGSALGDVTVVDLAGLPDGADAAKDGRIIAGIASGEGRTFFFKMRGNAALAESQKAGFIHWIGSVSTAKPAAGAEPAAPANPAPAVDPMAPAGPASAAAPGAETEKPQIKWVAPESWKPVAPTTMRYASFAAAGQNGEAADISVSVFGGDGGGDLGNVNRWRAQVGLGEVGETELKSLVVPVKGRDEEILTVDMTGPKGRILAGWARIGGKSWFFKLVAPDQLAGAEKAGFVKFLESVQLHP